jgi:hypothetical protein
MDPKKIESMKDWPCLRTLKIFHGFLGLKRYYRKFVQNYGKIAAPLITLLKKNYFSWTTKNDQSFQSLKEDMCMICILSLLEFTKTFLLECVSSRKGIGAILMHDGKPLVFTNKKHM